MAQPRRLFSLSLSFVLIKAVLEGKGSDQRIRVTASGAHTTCQVLS